MRLLSVLALTATISAAQEVLVVPKSCLISMLNSYTGYKFSPENALHWLRQNKELGSGKDLQDFLRIFDTLSKSEQKLIVSQILDQLPHASKKAMNNETIEMPERRVLEYLLAIHHNPQDVFLEGNFSSAREFLAKFLKERRAAYSASSIIQVAKVIQKTMNEQGIKKLTWVGSFPSGLGTPSKSDLDLHSEKASNSFLPFYKALNKNLKAEGMDPFISPNTKISTFLSLEFYAGISRLAIEITSDKINLALYPAKYKLSDHDIYPDGGPIMINID